jgi:hypothetical protein
LLKCRQIDNTLYNKVDIELYKKCTNLVHLKVYDQLRNPVADLIVWHLNAMILSELNQI